ncbi:hypothetical protein FGADI_12523 [Fusarium gaditjirri]|uniref:Uncharacterized protein n=1 Tax=Fusarium gaditjirri TaxID=282569 RepID=A0A8H4WNY1_9HYPO|nr:hypothetical protein FGADI_12523 [Fusarium gaditjirri]
MRFSLLPVALCLLSTQTGIALAGPCRPSSSTTLSAVPTTTTLGEDSTTIVLSEATSTTLSDETTTISLSEASTTTSSDEALTTTISEESTTITSIVDVTTTTLAEASTTTTAGGPEGTPLKAHFADGKLLDADIAAKTSVAAVQLNSNPNIPPARATFAIDNATYRLYARLPDGSVLYASTIVPIAHSWSFNFNTKESIENSQFDFVICGVDDENFLICSPEAVSTYLYFFYKDYALGGDGAYYTGDTTASAGSWPIVKLSLS